MTIPKPYFKDLDNIGDLIVEEVLVMYDYPLLMTLKDTRDNRYLCVCFDTRGCQQWLLSRVSNKDLIRMLSDKLTLHDAFLTQETIIHIVYDYITKGEKSKIYSIRDIPKLWLPTPGEYLEVEEGEFDDFINILEKELENG